MKHIMPAVTTLIAVGVSATAAAQEDASTVAQTFLPERAIVLHGDGSKADSTVIGIFYSRENLNFSDADAPRFLLLDREGKIAFGIGGSVYAVASYDFNGSIPSPDFTTYDITVPNSPLQRQRFGANVSNSSLFAKLVGKSEKFGIYQVYIQGKFTGDNGGYGFKLKQAYASVGHFTAGLTTSTFVDAAVQAPTIDPEGDSGQIADKTMLFRYTSPSYKGFSYAVSVELPSVSNTYGTGENGEPLAEEISQRVPDIPAYVQYAWDEGNSHVRVSGILRNLTYRDIVDHENRFATCWGVKLSTIATAGMFQPFGHVSYGKGIGTFINDLGGNGYDLIPCGCKPGRETPATSLTYTIGTYANFTSKCFATTSFSRAQCLDCGRLGGDSYRYAMYCAVNAFYNVDENLRLGAEYLHGWRANYDGQRGTANRINVLMQYSF